jgi:hypothetical protein
MWFKADSERVNQYMLSLPSVSSGSNGFDISSIAGGCRVDLSTSAGFKQLSYTTQNVQDGGIYHIVATYDGSDIYLYVNGDQVATTPHTGTINQQADGEFNINRFGSYGRPSDGYYQNVRIWNRALTADEVTLLYERPWEGEATYGDLDPYDPPPTLALKAGEAINTGCVGWWPLLEEDDYASGAADISGNANNGTQSGSVLSAYSPLGGVASFDGVDDYIDCTAISQGAAGSFTLSVWCNPDTASKDQRFFTKWNVGAGGTNPDLFNIWYDIGGSNVGYAFAIRDASLTQTIIGDNTASGGVGVWSHVVGVYDSAGPTMTLYVDGAQVASGAATAPIAWNTNDSQSPVRIGAILAERADGLAQNARIWSRALSAVEVQSLYETPWIGSNYPTVAEIFNYIFRSKRFRRL